MGMCPKCGRGNGKSDKSLCWECYTGITDACKNGPKMVGGVPQQQKQQPHSESPTIRCSFTGYFKKHWYKNGNLYSGYMQDGYRHGKGKYTLAGSKYTYDGDWYMSKRHGHGEEEMPGKWRFSGEFYNNMRNGYGKLIYADGESYEGEWKDGKLNGYAVVRYSNGRIYEGYFVDNVKSGSGKIIAPDGSVTVGHWDGDSFVADSVMHGDDTATAPKSQLDKNLPDVEEKECSVSLEGLADFTKDDVDAENEPKEESAPTVTLMPDFQKRFAYFDQALYGIDKNGVLHISSKMNKNKEVIEDYNGSSAGGISCYEAANIIILGNDGSVLLADSTWKKGMLADKEIKALLPEVQNWSGLSAVACGNWHFVGLHTDGTVIGAGKKMCHLEEVSMWESVKAIACSRYGTVGLCDDGTVVSCGFPKAVADELASWTNITAIACGKEHIVGQRQNGTVVACGDNSKGQCDVDGFSNVGMISASGQCTALVFNDGTIKALGKFADASLGFESGIVAAVCANFGNILRLTTDGNIHGDTGGVNREDFKNNIEW